MIRNNFWCLQSEYPRRNSRENCPHILQLSLSNLESPKIWQRHATAVGTSGQIGIKQDKQTDAEVCTFPLKNAAGTPAKVFHFWPKSENHNSDQTEGYTSASMRENIKNTSHTLLTLQIHLANAMGVLPDLPHGFMTQSGCARFGQITHNFHRSTGRIL